MNDLRPIRKDDLPEETSIDVREYWALLVRRRWYLTIPIFVLGLAGFAVSLILPVRYESEAVILIEQQKVPAEYVTSNILTDLQHRLDAMTQEIMSRPRLQNLIEQFGLYPRERATKTIDDVVDKMRKDIDVEMVQAVGSKRNDLTAFRIRFRAGTPQMAQRVTDELTSLFINQNIQERTQQSVSTTQFLESQLAEAHKSLLDQEQRLREFKLRNLGELPQQEQGNLHVLNSLQSQLQIMAAAQDRAEQQKVYLESMRSQHMEMLKALEARGQAPGAPPPPDPLETRLQEEERILAILKTKYADRHPDVIAAEEHVAATKLLVEKQNAERAKEAKTAVAEARNSPETDQALIDIESRLKAVDVEIAKSKEAADELRNKIRDMQTRLARTPVREQELAEVTRNYENSKAYYESLLQKKLGSELATNLEKRQQGEQFSLLDPPTLPHKPEEPNRLMIVGLGWLAGIGLGIGLIAGREIIDGTVRGARDVAYAKAATIVVSVPRLRTPGQIRWLRAAKWLEAAWIAAIVIAIAGTSTHAALFV